MIDENKRGTEDTSVNHSRPLGSNKKKDGEGKVNCYNIRQVPYLACIRRQTPTNPKIFVRNPRHKTISSSLPGRMWKKTLDPRPIPLLRTRLFSILPAASPPRVRIRPLGHCYIMPMAPSIPPFRSAASLHSVAMARARSCAAHGTSRRATPIFGSAPHQRWQRGLEDEHQGPGQAGRALRLAAVDGEDAGDRVHDELGRIHAELERGGASRPAARSQALGEAGGAGGSLLIVVVGGG
jgi:hypothetical protein